MSLKAQIAAGVMQAFIAIGDVAKNLTLVHVTGQPRIDSEAGVPVTPSVSMPVPLAVFVRMKHDELGDDIAAKQDQKVIFPMVYAGGDNYVFNEADYILDRAGRRWEIKRFMPDPSYSVFIAQVRD